MKNRIEKILKEEQIASSKFADEIGIQRSSMSHILSGRNKPSLDIIQRILRKFPHINSDWLILGVGDMYDKTANNLSLFDNTEDNSVNNTEEETPETIENIVEEEAGVEYHSNKQQTVNKPVYTKKIKKIMVFYDDGSFEEIVNM